MTLAIVAIEFYAKHQVAFSSMLCFPRKPAQKAALFRPFDNLSIHYREILEPPRWDFSRVHRLDVDVCPVLRLWLEEIEAGHDEKLSSDEQEHDLAAPVELIRVDEVWEDRTGHERGELLADEDEGDGFWASCLGCSLLSDGPTVASDCGRVEHRPYDHEGQEAMTAAAFVVGTIDVPAMITLQNMRMTPPPMRPFRRGMRSERKTATRLERNCSVDEMAVRPNGSAWPINSKQ